MIILSEIADKLEKVLNGVDEETLSFVKPNDFLFRVNTVGYHLDHIYDRKEGKNFIPVFINTLGGQYNPIPNLKNSTYNVQITIYFPVRFKEQFYAINDYLVDCFVGKQLNYGALSGKCLSNISVAEYGDFEGLDLGEFKTWVKNNYQETIDVMEKWMTMTFTLFLNTVKSGFMFGNSVKYELQFQYRGNDNYVEVENEDGKTTTRYNYELARNLTIDGVTYYALYNGEVPQVLYQTLYLKGSLTSDDLYTILEVVVVGGDNTYEITKTNKKIYIRYFRNRTYTKELNWVQSGTGLDISPISQQLVNQDSYAKNVANITNYSKSIVAYIDDSDAWKTLLECYNNQDWSKLSGLRLRKTYEIGGFSRTFTYNQLMLSMNENVALGELISFTISFGDSVGV